MYKFIMYLKTEKSKAKGNSESRFRLQTILYLTCSVSTGCYIFCVRKARFYVFQTTLDYLLTTHLFITLYYIDWFYTEYREEVC